MNPGSPPPAVVVFDLDGTLYSSESILGPAYAAAIREVNARWRRNLAVPETAAILAQVGRPAKEILASLYPDLAEGERDELSRLVLAALTDRIRGRGGRLFEGVPETLAELRRAGHVLAVVSNARRSYLEAILAAFDLARHLESAACHEDAPELGKAGLLRRTLAGRPGVMVGDRASDGLAARAAGVPWIGCAFGHAADEAAELASADVVIRRFAELPAALARTAP